MFSEFKFEVSYNTYAQKGPHEQKLHFFMKIYLGNVRLSCVHRHIMATRSFV